MAEAEHPSPIQMEVQLSRAESPLLDSAQMLYAMLDLRSKEALNVSRRRLNLALVIDRSTSMQGARIRNVKMAAMDLLETLQPDDWLSIVSFSDRAEGRHPANAGQRAAQFQFGHRVSLAARGNGDLPGVAIGVDPGGTPCLPGLRQSRVAADRWADVWRSRTLALHATQQARKYGIGVSAFGIGEDWNDVFLDTLARKGGGVAQYISSPSQMREVLQRGDPGAE